MRLLRTTLRVIAVLIAVAALVLFLIPTRHNFTEESLSAVVTVTDSTTGAPVPGATVTLSSAESNANPRLHPPPSWAVAQTDSAGRAAVKGSFAVESTFLHHEALVQGATLSVEASGYRPAGLPLADSAQVSWRFFSPVFRPTIPLRKRIPNEFAGRWYSKMVHDGELFMTDVFTRLTVNPDGTFVFDVILKDQNTAKPLAWRFGGPVGNWSEQPYDYLFFKPFEGPENFEAEYVDRHLKLLHQVSDPKSDNIMYRLDEAPWAHIDIIENPESPKPEHQ